MTASEYEAIARACDRILLARDATLETVAVSWLHVHNEHPVNVQKYSSLASKPTPTRMLTRFLRRSAPAALLYSLLKRGRTEFSARVSSADVLFVSHLLSEAQAGEKADFYFGELPHMLARHGVSAVVALRNHTSFRTDRLARRWRGDDIPRVVLPSALHLRDEARIRRRMATEHRRLRQARTAAESSVERAVYTSAAAEALSFAARSDLRVYLQIEELVRSLRPRALIITFEGHGWERLAFHAARTARPGIRCIGYHHTILFPRQHAIRRSLGPGYDPDVVLTVGSVTRDALLRSVAPADAPVEILGSIRRPPLLPQRADSNRASCLVIPDGTIPEYERLFGFALQCAALLPATRFIFRTHPVLPFSAITARSRVFRQLPANVELSSRAIADDIAASCWALYRGSSAVLAAVLGGVRPLYLEVDEEMPIDPLHALTVWRRGVARPADLVAIVTADSAAGTSPEDAAAAIEFCQEYLHPVDADVLLRLVS